METQGRPKHELTLPRAFLRMCRANRRRPKVADSTGAALTGAGLLARTWVLRRLLRREVLAPDERFVGLLLPPSVAAVVANAGVTLDRRIAVNLNYTASSEVLNECIAQCGIRHVLTSRRVIERFPLNLDAEAVYLEDFPGKVGWSDRLAGAAAAWLVPATLVERWLGLTRDAPDDLLTVIFTSGSTGRPKGVMLSHGNVGSNVAAIVEVFCLKAHDVLVGILPLFHSFGYTVTLWTALTCPQKVVYHYTPLDARRVGQLCREHSGTILTATPTFLRSYLRQCPADDFATLELVVVGAEKLPDELADAFAEKFGVDPSEGYGTTELSPVVASNLPAARGPAAARQGSKRGTVGRPLPGVSVKVVDLETGRDLGPGQPGMLLVKGPNVMRGYLGRPGQAAEVVRDGWYVTGDVAALDDEGFIRITDRASRFAKIGGEMVPHLRVEQALRAVLGWSDDELRLVVTSVADARKGERLVVLHTGLPKPPETVCRDLVESGLAPLWIPSPASFRQVDEIPLLGTGTLDLKRIRDLAREQLAGESADRPG